MPLVFRVSTRSSGRRRFVRVSVYDTVEELRAAAHRYTQSVGTYEEGEFSHAYGVTHSFSRFHVMPDGSIGWSGPSASHIRLWRGALGSSVVTHEAAHAAMGIYGQDCLEKDGPVHDSMDNEEIFCYLLGDLSRAIVDRLYHYELYENDE